jgi:nucleotide-binding universal stress UspA family protein
MDALRSLLVHMDAGRASAQRLALARVLAARHEARLQALFAVVPRFVPVPLPLDSSIATGPLLDEIDAEHRRRARAGFEQAASGPGWPMQWLELAGGPPVPGFVQQALHADLLVLGQHDASDADTFDVPPDFAESVIVASGRPALVVPPGDYTSFDGFGSVLLAWQATREAARALEASVPLLQRAREVHVVTWGDDDALLSRQHEDLQDDLRLHGVIGAQWHRGPVPADAGAALLALAQGLGADLLVMGCYGHSRARELVLGGASRTVLRHAELPVLMAH